MKCHIPQISWHNRDPVLSIDCQTAANSVRRIATAGTDTHVLIWLLHLPDKGTLEVEFVADLNRHTRTVNVVRFSPNGEILASGDDEASIILWKLQTRDERDIFDDDDGNKEHWVPLKILRGHIDDVCDLCWSKDSLLLISGSVDNSALLWDIQKGKNVGILSDHKGFVQGVAWDPIGQYYATLSSDRTLRIFSQQTKKTLHKVQKAAIPNAKETSEGVPKSSRIFYDDTMKTFCRRLAFSPDGEILVVPSGIIEQEEGKFMNASYVFSRHALNRPVVCLPTNDKFTIAVRFCPILFTLKPEIRNIEDQEKESRYAIDLNFNLPYRIVFAVATQNAILVYDTQHILPIAHISNIHYTRLTDLSWSCDGKILMASSTDGYCSFVIFDEGELGEPYKAKASAASESVQECKHNSSNISGTEVTSQETVVEKAKISSSTNLCPPFDKKSEQNESCEPVEIIPKILPLESSAVSQDEQKLSPSTSKEAENDEPMVIDCENTEDVLSTGKPCSSLEFVELKKDSVDVSSANKLNVKPKRRVQLVTLARK